MARQRVSRQELNRRKLARSFVGRTEKLSMFRDNLGHNPQDEDFQYLFHVHGNAGVGKTSLVRQWETAAQARDAVTVYLDDEVHDPLEVMETIAVQMDRQGLPLRAFQDLLANYRQLRHEAETAPLAFGTADPSTPDQQTSVAGNVLAQASVVGLGMLPIPGAGALASLLDPQHVARQLDHSADRLRAMVASRLRSHDDVQLVISPLRVLTPVFLQDLAKAAERRAWVVLFFDVFERTGPLLNEWLPDVMVGEEYGTLPLNVIAVLSGQGQLDTRHWGDHRRLIWEVPLQVFTEGEVRELLATHDITDEEVIEVIVRLTGRLPVLVDLLAQTRPQDPTDIEDPADTAVDRFLKWITDPARREAALACALPLQLDEDVYRAAVPEAAADQYTWLRELPFVSGRKGRTRYHDIVRTPMLRLQRTRSAARWQQQHQHLADTYRRWRQERETPSTPGTARQDPDGFEHQLNETYHRLCANPIAAWPDTLAHLIEACDHDTQLLPRWAQILIQAGQDTQHSALTSFGNHLQAAVASDTDRNVAALTQLLTAPELLPARRALAHTLRGRDHRIAGRYDQALTDYATALSLDPGLARAHYGVGETQRLAQRYDQALTSLTRAIELDPTDTLAITTRGQTYRALQRYDDALTDLTRAIELDPTNAWFAAERGHTHRLLQRYDDSLTDFNRAIELNPAHAWTINSRAEINHALQRYGDALTDHNRAIELDPTNTWVITSRGETHHAQKHYDEALTDFDRAIELDPTYAWAINNRGRTYRSLKRYDQALTDHTRAIELDPTNAWAIAERGETHRFAKNYEQALTDFDRAIELNPTNAWAIGERGQTYHSLKRYDQAFTDHTRAIELNPTNAWAINNRGRTYHSLKRYDDALTDFDRAIELDPTYAWAINNRGQTYRALQRYDDALTDHNRALELDPNVWYHCEVALDMHLLGLSEERDHWQAAKDLLTAEELSEVEHQGRLAVVQCALGEWAEAAAGLDQFLTCGPRIWHIRDVLSDLGELESVLAVNSAALRPLRQKLNDAERAFLPATS